MQEHQREQRERSRYRANRVLRQERGEPNGLVAQLSANRFFRMRREIPLVEELIEHGLHGREPGFQRVEWRRPQLWSNLAKPIAGAREPFVHVRVRGEKAKRDLRNAEPTQCLQREHQLRLPGNRIVTADEEHA